jgi:hypothetical protein
VTFLKHYKLAAFHFLMVEANGGNSFWSRKGYHPNSLWIACPISSVEPQIDEATAAPVNAEI